MRTNTGKLAAAAFCLSIVPASAGEFSSAAGLASATQASMGGIALLSEQEMDSIVAGVTVARYLRTGNVIDYFEGNPDQPIYRQITMPEQGAQKMFAGEGPNNNGVTSLQDYVPDGIPPGLPLTVDGTIVGTPSDRGAAFITIDITF